MLKLGNHRILFATKSCAFLCLWCVLIWLLINNMSQIKFNILLYIITALIHTVPNTFSARNYTFGCHDWQLSAALDWVRMVYVFCTCVLSFCRSKWTNIVHLYLHQWWKTHFVPPKALPDDTFTVYVSERHLGWQADGVPVRRRKLQLSSEDLIKQLLLHVILTGERR